VITLRELALGLSSGAILVLFALVPSLFRGLAEGLRNHLNAMFPDEASGNEPIEAPRLWLAGMGFAVIVLTVFGYTTPNL
jgi:hypothetical protein